jgi:hypothetical protein
MLSSIVPLPAIINLDRQIPSPHAPVMDTDRAKTECMKGYTSTKESYIWQIAFLSKRYPSMMTKPVYSL